MPTAPNELAIRAPRPDDLAGLVRLVNLPGVRHGTLRLPFTGEADVRRRWIEPGPNVHPILGLLGDVVVAQAALIRHDGRRAHCGEVFLAVHDDHIRRGIGRRMAEALIDLADDWLGLVRLELGVDDDNAPAIALYEGLGFLHEGTNRAATLRAGALIDVRMMARLRPPPSPA
jgi:L-phenylalanine/L-methionine N-acetyltransferase